MNAVSVGVEAEARTADTGSVLKRGIRLAAEASVLQTASAGSTPIEAELAEAVSIHVVPARAEALVAVQNAVRSTAVAVVVVRADAS